MISKISPEWDSQDAKNLETFLKTQTGERLLSNLVFQIPTLLDGGDVNKTLVRSGEVKGSQATIEFLISLLIHQPPQPSAPENYPSIDDDSAWPETPTNGDQSTKPAAT